MKIMLDAGHGYNTPGKRSPDGMIEYEFNRAVALHARSLLQNYQNVTVYFAHSDNRDVPLQERTNNANSLNVDIYVSIHANAFGSGGWTSASGIETYIYTSKPRIALQLAQKIQRNLVAETGLPNRGVKTADFHVLRETKMDGVLVECGFMTNQNDLKLLRSEEYRRTIAEGIVKAVSDQFNLKRKSNPSPPSTSGLYKVQAGAFKAKKNADDLATKLRSAGYTPYVYQENGYYKVQVGAFERKQNADSLVSKLRNEGYETVIFLD
ncbi:N-acetylmuramoyl-L-alanine amidase [Mesobacillus maritimus]|uniref:N-acetylmuramoyl-L-alanine amidase n=1 Tax=Mesobacillus maritimus TaxID=1643336 RepID=A0ABS7K471_9BACI|nr:N-acetylmuramoyl-L-alanine amidase [Mesobacillus maritimus]MBY0097063.1 N-acetylmuramoyl-L-alanine amidase [Mesobacillus maritimus]